MSVRSSIVSTGLGVPSKVFTNKDFEQILDTSDEWIVSRTGIRERRFLDRENGEFLHTICERAGKEAIEKSGLKPEDIDLCLLATTSPDTFLPNTSSRLTKALGLKNAAALDQSSACAGYVFSLHTADAYIRAGFHKNILVFGADAMSAVIDMKDRSTAVLFGDGAGAAVVKAVDSQDPSKDSVILGSKIYTDFDENMALAVPGGGSMVPQWTGRATREDVTPYIQMNGQEVFKNASRGMVRAAKEVLAQAGYGIDQVDWFVPHQANLRIIEMVGKMLELSPEQVYINLDRWGNTSAGTVATCLAEMEQKSLLKKGQLVLLDVFGGGFSYGALLVRW